MISVRLGTEAPITLYHVHHHQHWDSLRDVVVGISIHLELTRLQVNVVVVVHVFSLGKLRQYKQRVLLGTPLT